MRSRISPEDMNGEDMEQVTSVDAVGNLGSSPADKTSPGGASGCEFNINSFVFLDLETSHLHSAECPTIIEMSLMALHRSALLHPTVLSSMVGARRADGSLDLTKIKSPRVADKLTLCLDPRKHTSPMTFMLTNLDNLNLNESKKQPFDDGLISILRLFLARQESPTCLIAHNGNKFDFPVLKSEFARLCKDPILPGLYCVDSLEAFRDDFALKYEYGRNCMHAKMPPVKRKAPRDVPMADAVPNKKEASRPVDESFTLRSANADSHSCNDAEQAENAAASSRKRLSQTLNNHTDRGPSSHQHGRCEPDETRKKIIESMEQVLVPSLTQEGFSSLPMSRNGTAMGVNSSSLSMAAVGSSDSLVSSDAAFYPHSIPSCPVLSTPSASVQSDTSAEQHANPGTMASGELHVHSSIESDENPTSRRAEFAPISSTTTIPGTPDFKLRRSPPPPPMKSHNPDHISRSCPDNRIPKVSLSLANIFKRTFGTEPPNAHAAEDDILSLMRVILPRVEEFVDWTDKNASEFKDVPFYYKPLNPRRKLEF